MLLFYIPNLDCGFIGRGGARWGKDKGKGEVGHYLLIIGCSGDDWHRLKSLFGRDKAEKTTDAKRKYGKKTWWVEDGEEKEKALQHAELY